MNIDISTINFRLRPIEKHYMMPYLLKYRYHWHRDLPFYMPRYKTIRCYYNHHTYTDGKKVPFIYEKQTYRRLTWIIEQPHSYLTEKTVSKIMQMLTKAIENNINTDPDSDLPRLELSCWVLGESNLEIFIIPHLIKTKYIDK